jgi:hypothetical protein
VQIPTATETKYLGLHLDQRLTWRKHIQTKSRELDMKHRQMYWLLNIKSKLSMTNWMFPLQANHLYHLYLILCNDVDCKEANKFKKKLKPESILLIISTLRWPRDTLYLQKLALTSPTSGGRWV